jgi:DNA-binding transcriptional LysR family regulator
MMKDLDLSLLRTFTVIAAMKNFTKAASCIGLTQSAVTQQINKLEEQLGVQLLERNKRKVVLTPYGEILLSQANKLLLLNDQLISQFQETQAEGEVRFGSPEDFATHFLPNILADFVRSHPNIHLKVCCELTLNLIESFEKKMYDLIIIKQQPGKLYPGAKPLWLEQLVWVGQKQHIETIGHSSEPLNLVLSPDPCVYRHRALEALEKADLRWQIVYTSPSITGVIAAVRAGLGITVLPRNIVPPNLTTEYHTEFLPSLNETEICVLTQPNPAPAVQALEDYIRNLLHP